MQNSETKETDTAIAGTCTDTGKAQALEELARKLERERDEARKNAMTVGLERDQFTETIANLQWLNDNQRQQLVNLQNECALNNQTAQTWDRLSLESELTQLRKVCDELYWLSQYSDRQCSRKDKVIANYSTLPHVIKAKAK